MFRMVVIDVQDFDRIQKQLAVTMDNVNKLRQLLEDVQHVNVLNANDRDENKVAMVRPSDEDRDYRH